MRTLSDTVNDILDDKGAQSLSHRKDLELLWQPPKMAKHFAIMASDR